MSATTANVAGPILVVGSPATATDGSYQKAIVDAEANQKVEKQLMDRILGGATTLQDNYYQHIDVILAPVDYETLSEGIVSLFVAAHKALSPTGSLRLANLTAPLLESVSAKLTSNDFTVNKNESTGSLVATKISGTVPSVPLRRLTSKSDKKALWTTSSPATPPIDTESLLTEEDKARPVPVCEPGMGPLLRRKACKGCTCGLAEELNAEDQNRKVVVLGADGATETTATERAKLAGGPAKFTTSCGSCYLGDAFRCASCPYIGLPAFEPGQKVQIAVGMDDI